MRRHGALVRTTVLSIVVAACARGDRGAHAVASPEPEEPSTPVAPDSPTEPGRAGLPACQSLARAIDTVIACAPDDDEQAIAARDLEERRQLATSSEPIEDADRQRWAHACLVDLKRLVAELHVHECRFDLSEQERTWLKAVLHAVPPVTFPDGRTLSFEACYQMANVFDRDVCVQLLDDVHACRGARVCVDPLVEGYLESERLHDDQPSDFANE